MTTLETISARHSYRGKYLPTPVPREHLTAIMQAGLDAPSGCNKQTTSIIAVDDPPSWPCFARSLTRPSLPPLRPTFAS